MKKISIVIPAYNVEKTLVRCLDSIYANDYPDKEVIVVNDGSKDATGDILKAYGRDIIIVEQENQGLSMARNNGIKKVTGEYFIVVDSDDYIEPELLEKLAQASENDPDVVRFQLREIKGDKVSEYPESEFAALKGPEAFQRISGFKYVEPAWLYMYRTEYWRKNDFAYKKGMLHEDYGLTPLVVVKADKVSCISYCGYNYIENPGSIMTSPNYEKIRKRVYDTFYQYQDLIRYDGGPYYKSFLANSVIIRSELLNLADFREFEKLLKKERVFDNLLDDTLPRKIKKLLMKISLRKYLEIWR